MDDIFGESEMDLEPIELPPELEMAIRARMSQKAEFECKDCPHLGVQTVGTSAKWCPQCWRLFPRGVVQFGNQHDEGKWVVILPPYVWEDLMGLYNADDE